MCYPAFLSVLRPAGAGGAVRETLAHPDFVFSMEWAFRHAARFLELAPDAEATPERFEAVLSECSPRPRGLTTMRGVWAVGHLRKIAASGGCGM